MISGSLDSVQRAEPLEIIRNSALALPDALFLERGHPCGSVVNLTTAKTVGITFPPSGGRALLTRSSNDGRRAGSLLRCMGRVLALPRRIGSDH
jgi:hypothetical protein